MRWLSRHGGPASRGCRARVHGIPPADCAATLAARRLLHGAAHPSPSMTSRGTARVTVLHDREYDATPPLVENDELRCDLARPGSRSRSMLVPDMRRCRRT